MWEATQVQTTIMLTTHSGKVFFDIAVPRKQAKFLKNTPEGVHPQ